MPPEEIEDKPPFLKTWNRIYAAVMLIFVILVILFYWMTISLA